MENNELQDRVDRFKRATKAGLQAFERICAQFAGDDNSTPVLAGSRNCPNCRCGDKICPAEIGRRIAFSEQYQREQK